MIPLAGLQNYNQFAVDAYRCQSYFVLLLNSDLKLSGNIQKLNYQLTCKFWNDITSIWDHSTYGEIKFHDQFEGRDDKYFISKADEN